MKRLDRILEIGINVCGIVMGFGLAFGFFALGIGISEAWYDSSQWADVFSLWTLGLTVELFVFYFFLNHMVKEWRRRKDAFRVD